MARLQIETEGRRRIYEILEDRVTVGSDKSSQVRLRDGRQNLLLTRRGDVYRVAALLAGEVIRINGDDVAEHTLRHGDRIELGGSTLLFLDEDQIAAGTGPAAPPLPMSTAELADAAAGRLGAPRLAPRSREAAPDPRRQRERRRRRRDPRTLAMTSAFVCLAAATVFYLVKTSPAHFSKSPEALLALAEHQAQQGHLDRALGTLQNALRSQPEERTKAEIERQLQNLEATLGRRTDQGVLSNAAIGFGNLEQFESAYVASDPGRRAACRELVRKIDIWLTGYRDTCVKYEEETKLVAEAEAMRARYADAARLTEPDTAEDVIFQAHSRVRVRGRRRYREAAEMLDAFLGRAPDDPRAGEVRKIRDELGPEGETWLRNALRQVERMIAADELDDARDQLDFLTEQALPEWAAPIETVRRALDQAGK